MNGKMIALTIGEQLGGFNRLSIMINAKNFLYSENESYLSFKFMKADKGINYIKITLNGKDLYDISFGKIWGSKYKVISEYNDIYCSELKSLFESETKLYLNI